MRGIVLILLISLVVSTYAYLYDTADDMYMPDQPKRSLENFWRNVHLQMPNSANSRGVAGGQKRTEGLSRASANAYYRLG
ncbi:unnamed protein product [Caenorhabditis bovis]|uniref:Uncharacterized protein n=1 Tax=Caenorhabditis bovis TaxID=2654633 RepID=A0A8S1EZR2_9PELO|nr:unnamed protein product [Caenorhabditis bovis]